MDTLTHIVLGACIGEAFAGKKLGKPALFWGALLQLIPDIDVVASLWLPTSENLLAHRGFTHSFLFAGITAPILALIAERYHRPHNIALRKWIFFFLIEILVHLFVDAFNAYGTGWLEPFSHKRFAFNTIFVADPLFSVGPAIAFTVLLLLFRRNKKRRWWWKFGVLWSSAYLLLSVLVKNHINNHTEEALLQQQISYKRYLTTPTPFNNLLWYVAAETDSGFYMGYVSVFDTKPFTQLHYFPRNEHLLKTVPPSEETEHLKRFSQGYYTIEKQNSILVFNDLRFGQIAGWQNPQHRFAFHYFLNNSEQSIVIQRGRMEGWNKASIRSMLQRIKGN